MKILKGIISVYDHDGEANAAIATIDAIEHEGKLWLVPEWIRTPDGKQQAPVRIVHVIETTRRPAPAGYQADFYLTDPIPRAVFAGQIPPPLEQHFLVEEEPSIWIPVPASIH
jgi:hypothetical protein